MSIKENVITDDEVDEAEESNVTTHHGGGKRLKPKRGLGSAVTRKRRLQAEQLQTKINERIERERRAAQQELERLRQSRNAATVDEQGQWANSLLRSVITDQIAVMRAFKLDQLVHANVDPNSQHVVAWTDWKQVVIKWPKAAVPYRFDRDKTLDTIAQMQGVFQHEMGHIRFTTSWGDVLQAVSTSQHPADLLFKCWNMLEDQRMESKVVESVPRIATYFGTMVANVCLVEGNMPLEQTWLMLAGRSYLPVAVLRKSYILFDQFCFDQGIKNGAATWYNLVQDYKSASTHKDIHKATERAYEFIQKVRATMPPATQHQQQTGTNDPKAGAQKQRGNVLDMFDETPPQPGKGKGQKSDQPGDPGEGQGEGDGEGEDGEGEGSGAGQRDDFNEEESQAAKGKGKGKDGQDGDADGDGEGEGNSSNSQHRERQSPNKPSKSQSNHGDGTEAHTDEATAEALADELKGMRVANQETTRKNKDLLRLAQNANVAADTEGLPEYDRYPPDLSADRIARAHFVSQGIERALNSFVTEAAPTWQYRKEHGIIDALAYRTKATGSRDYRRLMDDHGNSGLDVHVSMLCDVSGSMSGEPIVSLSEALFATANACGSLDIGATFTLWSSDGQNYRVWGDGNVQPSLWPAMGGTDPLIALDDLVHHNPEEASNHLVVIFTDGQWAHNFPSLQRWAAPGRTFVLVRYGRYDGEMQKDMGADSHINISDVLDLPQQLTNALIDVLAQGGGW